jgi:hypothetical protein
MVRSLRKGLQGAQPAAQAPKRWFTREQLHERIFERIRELGIPLDADRQEDDGETTTIP